MTGRGSDVILLQLKSLKQNDIWNSSHSLIHGLKVFSDAVAKMHGHGLALWDALRSLQARP